jgi:hypothetical protein
MIPPGSMGVLNPVESSQSGDFKMREMVIGEIREDPVIQEIGLAKGQKQIKAFGKDLGQTFGTYNKDKYMIEIWEQEGQAALQRAKDEQRAAPQRRHTTGSYMKGQEQTVSAEKAKDGVAYQKTHQIYIHSPQKAVKEEYQYESIREHNDYVRRRNEVEDSYESLRRRTDMDYNYNIGKLRNQMRSDTYAYSDLREYNNRAPVSSSYSHHYDNHYEAPQQTQVMDVYEETHVASEPPARIQPAPKPQKADPIGPDKDHRGDSFPIGARKPSHAYEKHQKPRLDFTRTAEEDIAQNEAYNKAQGELQNQVLNYDHIVSKTAGSEIHTRKNLTQSKPFEAKPQTLYNNDSEATP